MVDSVAKILTVFLVVLLILLLLNTVGEYIAVQIPPAAEGLHHILQEIWRGLHGIVEPGYRN